MEIRSCGAYIHYVHLYIDRYIDRYIDTYIPVRGGLLCLELCSHHESVVGTGVRTRALVLHAVQNPVA